jgi:NADPH:quinone reductase-like Zn-dependent oxidoreductase
MIAFKPLGMTDIEAASVPVVAVTAWQMLSDYEHAERGQTVMVLGPISSESRTACDRSGNKERN